MSSDRRLAAARQSAPHTAWAPSSAATIAELDRVTVGSGIVGDEGEVVPSGSSGTVVAVWGAGAAFEVEFEPPVSALATVRAESITAHHPREPR